MSENNSLHAQTYKRKATNSQDNTNKLQPLNKKLKLDANEGEKKRQLTDQSINTTTHGTPFQSYKKLKMNGKVNNNLRKKPVKKITIKGLVGKFVCSGGGLAARAMLIVSHHMKCLISCLLTLRRSSGKNCSWPFVQSIPRKLLNTVKRNSTRFAFVLHKHLYIVLPRQQRIFALISLEVAYTSGFKMSAIFI